MDFNEILVTGGLGQIGSFIVDYIIEHKISDKVLILDNNSSAKKIKFSKNVEIIEGNINDMELVNRIFNEYNISGVIHCAAQIYVPKSFEDPMNDAEQNIIGTLNLLIQARMHKIKRFVTIGSAAVLGEQEEFPIKPTNPTFPKSPYGLSKYTAEKYTQIFGETYNLNYNVVRPFNVYSERMKMDDPYSGVIMKFMLRAISNKPYIIEGDGKQCRDFIYAGDVAEICVNTLLSDYHGKIINASTGIATTILELTEIINRVMGVNNKIIHTAERIGDIKISYGEVSELPPKDGFLKLENGLLKLRHMFE